MPFALKRRRALVQQIIRTIGGVLAISMGIYVGLPMLYNMKASIDWSKVPTEALTIRDNVYNIFLAIAIPLIGMCLLWGYLSVSRRQSEEF